MTRKLASIQRISKLSPIENSDNLELAEIQGFRAVVKKGDFKENEIIVYIETDSVLPEMPQFEFMRARGFRVRMIRLRGTLSQGLCFPLSILPFREQQESDLWQYGEGTDVTNVLGITKYEPPIPAQLQGDTKGPFPSFLIKTDETRVQVLQSLLDKYKGQECYVTEKFDGSSATYFINKGEFGVCSRNQELKESEGNTFWKIAKQFKIEEKLRGVTGNFAIQGEIIGEGIQGNKYSIKGQVPLFFNVFNIDSQRYLSFIDMRKFLQTLELPTVTVINPKYILDNNIDELVKMATITSSILTDQGTIHAEGIVIRPHEEIIDDNDWLVAGRVSFKVISPEFLIKHQE